MYGSAIQRVVYGKVGVMIDWGSRRLDTPVLPPRRGTQWSGDVLIHSPRWRRGGRSRRRSGLNRFGRFALEAWSELAPSVLSQIPDPNKHFSELGEEAESQWADLWPQLAGPDSPGEDFFVKAGRIEAAKLQAEEMIREELLTPPVDEQDLDDGDGPGPLADVIQAWREVAEDGDQG